MGLAFRPAEPRDRASILSLFRVAFREEPDPAGWEWKYDRNPRRAVSCVAVDGGRIVGFFGAMATRYRGAGRDLPGAASGDIMTDPATRALGKGVVFKALGDAYRDRNAELGIPFDFGFPHERSGQVVVRLLSYVKLDPCGESGRPLGAPPLVGRLRRRFLRLREGVPSGRTWDAFAEALHSRPGLVTDRSADVVAWRLSRPGRSYRAFRLLDLRGRCRGFAVTTRRDGRTLLLDLQVVDERGPELADLLAALADALPGAPDERIVLRAPPNGLLSRRLREELGFLPEPSDTALYVRAVLPGVDPAAEGGRLDYRFWDHDVF